jgi:hypothetical protein
METIASTLNNIIQLLEPLYLILLVFINSVLMDLFLKFITIYSDDFLFATIPNLVRRASKAVVLGGVAAAGISYSLLVDLPGVNESQIRWGRGFGYKTLTKSQRRKIKKETAKKQKREIKIKTKRKFRRLKQYNKKIRNVSRNKTAIHKRIRESLKKQNEKK